MKTTLIAATILSAARTGCYVVPIDYRNPATTPAAPPAQGRASETVVIPAPQPQPVQLQARLYPLNDVAGKMGVLSAQVTDNLDGHGTFSLISGSEAMNGEASRVAADHAGFGSVYRQVYGEARYPAGGRRGIANAAGGRGSYMNCEYVLTAAARGTGACLFSNGAKYQIHFGT